MKNITQISSDLLMLTYAAQFDRPMNAGIRNVLNTLVEPKYPLQQEDYYLATIQRLLGSETPLSDAAPSVTGRTEREIREFLFELAKTLEEEYGFSRRSGGVVPFAGRWVCSSSGAEGEFTAGDVLPVSVDGEGVWVYQPKKSEKSAWEVLKDELARYYRPRFLRAAAGSKKNVYPYAEASYERMEKLLRREDSNSLGEDLACLLAGDGEKWEELNLAMGGALTNPDVCEWCMKFFSALAAKDS